MTNEQKAYGADVREQTILLPTLEEAEKLRAFLQQHEVDTVVWVPEERRWLYLRKRAMAVEQVASHQVPPAVTEAAKKRKRKGLVPVPDPPPEPPA